MPAILAAQSRLCGNDKRKGIARSAELSGEYVHPARAGPALGPVGIGELVDAYALARRRRVDEAAFAHVHADVSDAVAHLEEDEVADLHFFTHDLLAVAVLTRRVVGQLDAEGLVVDVVGETRAIETGGRIAAGAAIADVAQGHGEIGDAFARGLVDRAVENLIHARGNARIG